MVWKYTKAICSAYRRTACIIPSAIMNMPCDGWPNEPHTTFPWSQRISTSLTGLEMRTTSSCTRYTTCQKLPCPFQQAKRSTDSCVAEYATR